MKTHSFLFSCLLIACGLFVQAGANVPMYTAAGGILSSYQITTEGPAALSVDIAGVHCASAGQLSDTLQVDLSNIRYKPQADGGGPAGWYGDLAWQSVLSGPTGSQSSVYLGANQSAIVEVSWSDYLLSENINRTPLTTTTFTFGNLSQVGDNLPKSASVVASPANATFTSDVTKGPAPGSYTVSATAYGYFTGSGSATLVITQPEVPPTNTGVPLYTAAGGRLTSYQITTEGPGALSMDIAGMHLTSTSQPDSFQVTLDNLYYKPQPDGGGPVGWYGTLSWKSGTSAGVDGTQLAYLGADLSASVPVTYSDYLLGTPVITRVPVVTATFTFGNLLQYAYDNLPKTATVTVSPSNATYTADLTKGPAPGSYTVTATATGYYLGSGSATLVITPPLAQAVAFKTIASKYANQRLSLKGSGLDQPYYRSTYADLNGAIGNNTNGYWDHWQAYGFLEGRSPFSNSTAEGSAYSQSGLPVSFSVVSGPARIAGNQLTFTNSGTVVLRAAVANGLAPNGAGYTPAYTDQSIAVSLMPLTDTNSNGLPDAWETLYFGQLGVDPNADPDNDGWTNIEEYRRSTNPNSADPGGTHFVGTLPGSLSVDNKGSANYSIPLALAPGRGGMQPSVSLSYSSNGGNGPLGLGFSLSTGFPQSITRGRSILARDGETRGVTFTSSDKFYLDGKRLIYISGGSGYGTPGSTYRTEVDSFVTVTTAADPANSSNIGSFTVTDKSGTQMIFGKTSTPTTTDGYQTSAGEALAYTYAIKRVTDTLGNYVEFNYTSVGNGEYVLANVKYTGNSTVVPNIDPQVQVTFSYNTGSVAGSSSRTDASTSYIAGRRFSQTCRLDQVSVAMSATSTTTAIYNLGYEYAPHQGRTRLTTVAAQLLDPNGGGMKAAPATTFEWSNTNVSFTTNTDNYIGNYLDPQMPEHYAFGDVDGDGKDDLVTFGSGVSAALSNGTGFGPAGIGTGSVSVGGIIWKLADVNGDGKKDIICGDLGGAGLRLWCMISTGTSFVPLNGGTTPTLIYEGSGDFVPLGLDGQPFTGGGYLDQLGASFTNRIAVADFTGDGRDDILIHRLDGKLKVLKNQGSTFTANTYDVGANAVYIQQFWSGWFPLIDYLGCKASGAIAVSMIPCDLNGDGITDYAWSESSSEILNTPNQFPFFGASASQSFLAVTTLPGGGFSPKASVTYGDWGLSLFKDYPGSPTPGGWEYRESMFLVMPGDVNGDGLTDFTIMSREAGLSGPVSGHPGYTEIYPKPIVALSTGSPGEPQFEWRYPDQNLTVNVGGENVYPWFDKITFENWLVGFTMPQIASTFTDRQQATSVLGTANGDGISMCDVNLDGREDYVWYVVSATNGGWWVMYSLDSGFSQPERAPLGWEAPQQLEAYTGYYGVYRTTRQALDLNGDGIKDYAYANSSVRESPGIAGLHVSAAPKGDRITAITDGLGRKTDVAYKLITDNSVYTSGAAVAYPIRELRNATYVVSDVWHDAGTGDPADRAQFSYQYSGNRLDLSGRGGLGFHSFVTLDRQTNLFKYQFLAQSFPMTGLTAREETYRYWPAGGNAKFRFITSHDNTVVFDRVSTYGTLWPFVSRAIESRWEDSTTEHFSTPLAGSPESKSEYLFAQTKPTGAHITIAAQSLFDTQTAVQTSLPGGFYASDTNPANPEATRNVVSGTQDLTAFNALLTALNSTTYGKITRGNLVQLSTDYDAINNPGQSTETVKTTYFDVTPNGLSGLVDNIKTTVVSPVGGTEVAPIKRFTYEGSTPLVKTEMVDAGDPSVTNANSNLNLTTTYTRDTLGRVTDTKITSPDPAIGTYSVSSVPNPLTDFNATFDLPTKTQNAAPYLHPTTTAYHSFLGKPVSVTDVNGAQVTTQYDALGRVTRQIDALKNLTTTTAIAWDNTQTVNVPSGIIGLPGVTLTSTYSVTTTATVAPASTAYYDRLGRVIRTIKDGFNGQKAVTDTVYNKLGQTVATSLPYNPSDATTGPFWTRTTYDALGRVITITAPNGTITTNSYAGRVTTVNVTPSGGTPQFNATEVDAKGRTVKVWNPDPVTGNLSSAVSLEFRIDGFGRMRETWLEGSDGSVAGKTILAEYDAWGRQTRLKDPDKGNWTYLNNALGQVVKQTDAKSNVTDSTFDHLGRPLSRITTNTGYNETANFYYYDTDTTKPNTVAKGTKGWIGAPEREECTATGSFPTTNLHYYDDKGHPSLELAQTDGKWFYTYSDYDAYSRVKQVRHYWKPLGAEPPGTQPYVWQDFGYTYTYDGTGAASKSYLIALTDSLGRSWWDNPVYDHMDRVTSVRKGASLTTSRTYRPTDGVLTDLSTGNGLTQIQNMSFGFDGLGNLTSRTDTGVSETLTYDNLNRLKTNKQGSVSYALNGNIQTKDAVDRAVTITGYDSAHPHAVSQYTISSPSITPTQTINIGYDANGNLQTRTNTTTGETWNMKWAGFDKPRWMAKTTGATTVGSEFHYNAGRSRVMQLEFDAMTAGAPSHYNRKRLYALGSTLELNYNNTPIGSPTNWTLDTVRIYVPGPDGIVGAREFRPAQATPEKALVYHYDHLGSIIAVTNYGDASGALANDTNNKAGKYSEDAWGQRRNPNSWLGAVLPTDSTDDGGFDSLTPRGYTGHEMLDDLGLVHMNGRIYDPLLGRFLSADLVVQNPGSLQSYNRYSYVMNNPLTWVDPTGFIFGTPLSFGEFFSAVASGAASGAVSYGKGLAQGAASAVTGTAHAIAHPLDTVKGASEGLGTLVGRAVYDTSALGNDLKNAVVETVSDPQKIGQVVGNIVAGAAIGVASAEAISAVKGLGAVDEIASVAAKTENVALKAEQTAATTEGTTANLESRLIKNTPETGVAPEIKSGTSVAGEANAVERLPQDVAVNPKAPRALSTDRPIGKSPTQNATMQTDIAEAKANGATDFRVNQQQVNAAGERVGTNRPDLQYTDANGKRVYKEYDTRASDRGPGHKKRIQANDPNGKVILLEVE